MSGIFAAFFSVVFCMLLGLYAQVYRVYAHALCCTVQYEKQKIVMQSCVAHACGFYRAQRTVVGPVTFTDVRWKGRTGEPYRAVSLAHPRGILSVCFTSTITRCTEKYGASIEIKLVNFYGVRHVRLGEVL